jgi:hypothetical protein
VAAPGGEGHICVAYRLPDVVAAARDKFGGDVEWFLDRGRRAVSRARVEKRRREALARRMGELGVPPDDAAIRASDRAALEAFVRNGRAAPLEAALAALVAHARESRRREMEAQLASAPDLAAVPRERERPHWVRFLNRGGDGAAVLAEARQALADARAAGRCIACRHGHHGAGGPDVLCWRCKESA